VATRQQRKRKSELDSARGMAQWTVIYQTYNAIFKVAELALLPQRISLPQFHVLAVLKKGGGLLTTGQIGQAMVKASQTITGLVDRLEEPGLVERVFDRRDRRKTWVRLTPKGERKLAEASPVAVRLAEELSSVLTDAELQDVEAKVGKLRETAMGRLTELLARQQPGFAARQQF
jgi:MarR family 2-MHQ and catechol resistance regulon transcriptional repressor